MKVPKYELHNTLHIIKYNIKMIINIFITFNIIM